MAFNNNENTLRVGKPLKEMKDVLSTRIIDPYTYHYLSAVFILAWLLTTNNVLGIMAAWIIPILMIRFLRTQGRFLGFILGLCALLIPAIWLHQDKVPGGFGVAASITLFNTLALMFAYMSDRFLRSRFPWPLATLILPAFMTTWEYISALGNPFGTMLSPMNIYYGFKPFIQNVSWAGLWGLVFIPAWTATLFNEIWERNFVWARTKIVICVLGCLTLGWSGLGIFRTVSAPQIETKVAVMSVTPNPVLDKDISAALFDFYRKPEKQGQERIQSTILKNHKDLWQRIDSAYQPGLQILIMAESTEYVFAENEPALIQEVQSWAKLKKCYVQFSYTVFHRDAFFKGKRFLENLTVSIDNQGKIQNSHMKSVFTPGLESISHRIGNGSMPVTETPIGNWAAILGNEGDFPMLTLQAHKKALGILFILGNEWKGNISDHAVAQYFRGIELGCSVVRIFKNGMIAVADSRGHILYESNDLQSEVGSTINLSVPITHIPTVYSRYGNWLGEVSLYMCMVFIGLFLFKKYSLYQRWLKKPIKAFLRI